MKTALDWLFLNVCISGVSNDSGMNIDEIRERAEQMEKQQMADAYLSAIQDVLRLIDNTIDINGMIGSQIYPNAEIPLLELKTNIQKYALKEGILTKDCFVEKIILKDGYRACCGKEMTDDAAEKYCKDVWLKT